jgi:hypothetical protein
MSPYNLTTNTKLNQKDKKKKIIIRHNHGHILQKKYFYESIAFTDKNKIKFILVITTV